MTKQSLKQDNHGIMLITLMIVGLILTFVGLSIASLVLNQYRTTSDAVYIANATLVAEAGIEQTMQQFNSDSYTGFSTPQTLFNNSQEGIGQFTAAVTSGTGPNEKIIISTGKVYRKNNPSKVISTRSVKVTVVGTESQGYSVLTGPGGLILGGSANIVNSSIYVGGYITMNGASKIGTQSQPLEVDAGNYACPSGANPGSTYPSLCTSGQPISMSPSTAIYGSVCATGQTTSTHIYPGNGGTGLQPGCTAPNVSQPTYDRTAQINAVTTTVPSTDNIYGCNSFSSSSQWTRTWPANLRFNGDVTVAHSCTIILKGNVYITGNLTLDGSARILVDDSVGTTRPVILVDGKITVKGSSNIIANSSGTGAKLISFDDSLSNANLVPTGTDLYNSSQLETVYVGGAAGMPGTVFQAYWGKVTLTGSGNMGSAIGQTVDLSGAGTITFGTTLSSGSRTWTIRSYQPVYE